MSAMEAIRHYVCAPPRSGCARSKLAVPQCHRKSRQSLLCAVLCRRGLVQGRNDVKRTISLSTTDQRVPSLDPLISASPGDGRRADMCMCCQCVQLPPNAPLSLSLCLFNPSCVSLSLSKTILLYVQRSEAAYYGRGRRGGGGEGERVKARPRIPPEKDRRDRGPPPEQWKC